MIRPFALQFGENEAALIRECGGAFVIEPMQFLRVGAARAKAMRLALQERKRTGRINVHRPKGRARP